MALKIDRVQLEIVIQQDKARQRMIELESEMKTARSELNKIKKQFGENSVEYKKQAELIKKLVTEYDSLYEGIGLNNLSLKELQNRQKELNQILRNLPASSPLFKQYNAQLNEVNARIRELKGTAQETKFSLSKLADEFNRYQTLGVSVIATLTGIALTARGCVNDYAAMMEAQSQVTKYTGMTAEQVELLNEDLKRMDTRTAREQLNALAGDAGRLGIQAKDEVLDFVEAADMINVALGEDLGEDATKNIGKLAQMFGDAGRSLKDNMLAIGSAVNSVAQNSSAAEPYLVNFTARMGGVAKQARLSVTDVMGFASALDQNMLRSEMASTALQGLILKIYQEPAEYAKLAGMDVEKFVNLIETDCNEAILAFLSNLGQLGGMEKMAPILDKMKLSGAEAAGVISTLASNVATIRKEQDQANTAFVEGTSIVDEFNVQNNTVQAGLDKAKKTLTDLRVELGEELLPVMKYMISTGTLTVKGLKQIVSVFLSYKSTIATVALAVTGYTIAMNASVIADKAKVLWTGRVVTSLRTLYTVMKANPWMTVITLATTVVALYKDMTRQSDKLSASQRNLNDIQAQATRNVEAEKQQISSLLAIAQDETASKLRREAAIRKLNELSPEYLGNLSLEKIKTEEAAKAVKAYVDTLLIKQNIEAANQKKNQILEQRQNIANNGLDKGFLEGAWDGVVLGTAKFVRSVTKGSHGMLDSWSKQTIKDIKNEAHAIVSELDKQAADIDKYIEEQTNKLITAETSVSGTKTGGGTGVVDGTEVDEEALKKKFQAETEAMEQAIRKEQNELKQLRLLGVVDEEKYQDELYTIQLEALARRKQLYEKFGKDSSSIEEQILDMTINRINEVYNKRKEVSDTPEPTEDIDEDTYLIEKFSKSIEGREALLNDMREKDLISEQEYQDRMIELGSRIDLSSFKSIKEREAMLNDMHARGLISEQEYQDKLLEIEQEKAEQRKEIQNGMLQTFQSAVSAVSDLMQAMEDAEVSKVERAWDKKIKAAQKAGKDTTELEEQKEAAVNEVKKKYADKQFALSVLQVTSSTAVAAMRAYEALAGIPIVGPALGAAAAAAAVTAGAAQIAVAKQQRDEAKGLYEGGYSQDYVEGYTAKGDSKDVAGVIPVHKNEFVANHESVENPHVRQFLDVFDMAQRNGTIRMLDTTQILEQVRTRAGKYSGGYTSGDGTDFGGTSFPVDNRIIEFLQRIVALLQEGNGSLDKLAGKDLVVDVRAVRDGIRRVEKIEANASR
jgi:TP901 family phage tail tape measure protein